VNVLTIIGARPQFIKAAAVSRKILDHPQIHEVLVHTGQHFDRNMSQVFFEELRIPEPKYNLGIQGGTHGTQTAEMLIKLEEVLIKEQPDLVMIYGDTNSTLAGSLAAAKLHIPIAHVEAGLRSFNKEMPEEINRIVADHTADILFTPTETASNNLLNEGIDENKIFQVGDVMFDATLYYGNKAEKFSSIMTELNLAERPYSLVTIHRAENTNDLVRLREIFESLEKLAKEHYLLLPLHPRTKKQLSVIEFPFKESKIMFMEPVGYLDMLMLEKKAQVIITDSGGIQKEAFFHGIPCVTMRNETEWVELVENGWNLLSDPENLLTDFRKMQAISISGVQGIYGNGDASQKIVDELLIYETSLNEVEMKDK